MEPVEIYDRGRGPELKRCRVTVYDILPYYFAGDSPDYIAWANNITVPEVRALLGYFEAHRDEVMAVHNTIEERIARGNPPEVEEKLKAIRGTARRMRDELERRKATEANGDGRPG